MVRTLVFRYLSGDFEELDGFGFFFSYLKSTASSQKTRQGIKKKFITFFFFSLSISLRRRSGQAGWSMQKERIKLYHSTLLLGMCKCTLSWSQLGIGAYEKWCYEKWEKRASLTSAVFLLSKYTCCISVAFFSPVHPYFISKVNTQKRSTSFPVPSKAHCLGNHSQRKEKRWWWALDDELKT